MRATKLMWGVNLVKTDMLSMMKQYERLDQEIHGIYRKAKPKCNPTPAWNYEWSLSLAIAIKTISYWMQRLRHETKTPLIRKLGADINMKYTNISRKTIHQMIKYIKVKLSNIEKDTRQIRKEHLIKLTYNYSKENIASK